MKKKSVVTMFALLLALSCTGPTSVNAAPPNADTHPRQFIQQLPSILRTWEGQGMLLANTMGDGVRNIEVKVPLTINHQPRGLLNYGQTGSGPLFHGNMAISSKDPDERNWGGPIVGFPLES